MMTAVEGFFIGLGLLWSIFLLISIIQFIILIYIFCSKKFKLYSILQKNLSKDISIVLPSNADEYKMENERNSLDNKIFTNFSHPKTSYSNFKASKDIWLVIIGYKKDCVDIDEFKELLQQIWKNTPIIFYTYWDNTAFNFSNLEVDEFAKYLSTYDNYLVDNFPLKLIWDVFSLMSIYKKSQ